MANLGVQINKMRAKIEYQDLQNEKLSETIAMEQDTTNNLLMALETASTKIEDLEERRDSSVQTLEVRDNVIRQLEGVIEELTEQVKRDQDLLALAE